MYVPPQTPDELAVAVKQHQLAGPVAFEGSCLGEKGRQVLDQAMNDLQGCRSFREQCQLLHFNYGLSIAEISKSSGQNKGTVARHISKYTNSPKRVGRPSLLQQGILERIDQYVTQCFHEQHPVTYNDIQDFVHRESGQMLLIDTVRHIVSRNRHWKVVAGVPMESLRLQAEDEEIDRYFELLESDVEGVPAHFIFNADECGFDEWQDRRECHAIVPAEYASDSILVPVTRQSRRSTLLGCIAADGSSLQPFVVVTRKTISHELRLNGYTAEKVEIVHQENGFIDTLLFEQWAEEIFFREVERRREVLHYEGLAILIIDGCSAHVSDWFLEECLFRRISVIFLAPHSSDQTQPLDLGVFGIAKANQSRCRPDPDLKDQRKI